MTKLGTRQAGGRIRILPPVTTLALTTMLACAWATDSLGSRLPADALHRLGCAPEDYLSAQAWRALTSIPFTWGGLSFLGLLPLVAGSIGVCERTYGSRWTAAIFVATHVFAGLVEALALEASAPLLPGVSAAALLGARDVGPSAGCFGCVGAIIASLPSSRRALAAAGLALFLVAISFWRPDTGVGKATLWVSDLAHPIGAVAGFAHVLMRRRARREATS